MRSFFRGPALLMAASSLLIIASPSLFSQQPAAPVEPSAASALTASEVFSLDQGWWFNLGDIPFPVISGHGMSYSSAKAGKAWGAADPDFDDTSWRQLDLPHDWAVEGPFDQTANLSQGYRPRGIGWYRRYIRLDPADHGKSLELKFDGVSTDCTVWLNGTLVHRNWCGYTGFSIDMTPFATFGDQINTVVVRVDAVAQEGWWYEGAGIYRHTWLIKRNPVHLITDGVFAQPVKTADGKWQIPLEATIHNDTSDSANVEVTAEVLDPSGKVEAQGTGTTSVEALDESTAKFTIPVENPQLWSVESPKLYSVRTTVKIGGNQVDQLVTQCGFRTIRFDPNLGFFLNDQPVKLKGTCNHQDAAGVGVAVPDSIWSFRVRRLKELGSNAFRCAHNPPAPAFLAECDKQGLLVMDENRNFNVSPEYQRQLQWMVRRDRNHPSVILWSVFNEEPMQGTEAGYEMVRRMRALVRRMDTTRPVTAAMSGGLGSKINVSQAVDVVGFNYQQGGYDGFHKSHPNEPLTSSEDTSSFLTRGVYESSKTYADSYDDQRAGWGNTHRESWKAIASRPFVAGGFVWTGFDYRGEPQKFSWPSVSSVFGIMDTCGFPKSAYYMHQAAWIDDKPILQLIPHWNWKGKEGQPITVMAMTNGDDVQLFLNGKPLEEKKVDRLDGQTWIVNYEPGKLEAIAKKDGKEWAKFSEETTGDPVALKLTPDRAQMAGDGADAEPVTVSAIDATGREVPTANLPVTFEISGPAAIIGTGNGDNCSHEPEQVPARSLFNGLAQITLRSQRDGNGTVTLTAKSNGLQPGSVSITVVKVPPIPSVPPTARIFALAKWRRSPIASEKPDPTVKIGDTDMNSWSNIQPGGTDKFEGGTWAAYRISFSPLSAVQDKGGTLLFRQITGVAEVYDDGQLVGQKTTPEPAPLSVPLPAKKGSRTLTVLIDSKGADRAGLSGSVVVQ